ncbi:O-Antigen ligase [Roseovarius albus]|uniref:O-Antigen ligase n=1 Tax=Roseovarius albus TaxID=1247867 RepID=A0A1X6ZR70_9RHOB|nr:O-antigen ligase family protein [Roseovarius albus]SLN59134.1 O-Antigen ligase [Roseovarius albus]
MKTKERFPRLQWSLLWALMGCVLLAAVPLGANRPVSWSLLSLAVVIIFSLQLLIDCAQRTPKQTKGLWLPATLYLGAVAWGAVQLVPGMPASFIHPVWTALGDVPGRISADPGQGHLIVMRYLCYAMIFWVALRASISTARAEMMLKSIALASTLFAIYGLYALATGHNPILGEGEHSRVVTSTFVNRNSYATFAAFGILANIAAYLHVINDTPANDNHWQSLVRDLLERFFGGAWIYALGALLCMGALSLTQSRAGGIAALIGLVVFVATWKGKGQRWNPWLLMAVGAVVGFVILTSATSMTSRILATEAENGRFLIYPEVVNAIVDRPLLGHGMGAFHDVFRQYVPAEAAIGEWVRAHNSYLENIFEFGIPAAAAFYLALLLIVIRIYRATVTRNRNRAFPCFALAAIATAATHSLFDFSLQMPAIAALFAVILALGWTHSFSTRSARISKTAQEPSSPASVNAIAEPVPE